MPRGGTAIVSPRPPWKKIVDVDDQVTGFDLRGVTLYLLTHKDAPSYKVVSMRLDKPNFAAARVIAPQSASVIEQIAVADDGLYVLGARRRFREERSRVFRRRSTVRLAMHSRAESSLAVARVRSLLS